MAECANDHDGRLRAARVDWLDGGQDAIWLFVASGLHVLSELVSWRVVPGNRASSLRCWLVSADSAFLRAHLFDAVSVDGRPVYSHRSTGPKNLPLDARGKPEARSCPPGQATFVQHEHVLHGCGWLFTGVMGPY